MSERSLLCSDLVARLALGRRVRRRTTESVDPPISDDVRVSLTADKSYRAEALQLDGA